MSKRQDPVTRLLRSASVPKEEEPLVIDVPIQLPRRKAPTVRVPPREGSSKAKQQPPTSCPSTPTSASVKSHRAESKAGRIAYDLLSKPLPKLPDSPVLSKHSFRPNAPKPLKLNEKTTAFYLERPLNSREAATPTYEKQFRRRRGDLLHRLGPSVPYMQAYDPTSLQW